MVYKLILFLLISFSNLFAIQNLEKIESFKAKFEQKVTNQTSKSIIYKGIVYIKNSGEVLWRYLNPIEKNVYLLNNTVIIDEPQLEQAIYSKLKQEINILNILKEAKKIDEKTYSSNLNGRIYYLKVENKQIKAINFKDELDNNVSINFFDIKQNIKLEDKIFEFIPPKHYDIIEK